MLRSWLLGPGARRWWIAIFIVLAAVTLVAALLPAQRAPHATWWDKLDHALAFGSLGFAGLLALRRVRLAAVWVVAGLAVLGGAIEILQMYVPSRQADLRDVYADVIGAVIGVVLALALLRLLERRAAARDAD
ncbi:MAG: VanZ family protein [Rubrivivax sp.]